MNWASKLLILQKRKAHFILSYWTQWNTFRALTLSPEWFIVTKSWGPIQNRIFCWVLHNPTAVFFEKKSVLWMFVSQQPAALLVCVNVRFYVAIDCTAGPTCLTTVEKLAWGVVLCNEAFLPALHVAQTYSAFCDYTSMSSPLYLCFILYLCNFLLDRLWAISRPRWPIAMNSHKDSSYSFAKVAIVWFIWIHLRHKHYIRKRTFKDHMNPVMWYNSVLFVHWRLAMYSKQCSLYLINLKCLKSHVNPTSGADDCQPLHRVLPF